MGPPHHGVLFTDGVGEIELASAFRPYTELSYLARPLAVTPGGRPIRSRHGLTFVPRADLTSAAPELDRLLVPGADAALHAAADGLSLPERLRPVYLHQQPGFAFDGALRDIARARDVATARWVAKTLQYPTTNPTLSGSAWPWTLTLGSTCSSLAAERNQRSWILAREGVFICCIEVVPLRTAAPTGHDDRKGVTDGTVATFCPLMSRRSRRRWWRRPPSL